MKFEVRDIPVKIGDHETIIGVFDHKCDNCDTTLKREYEDLTWEVLHFDRPVIPNYVDALQVELSGGYGMYIDDVPVENRKFLLCKSCADKLIEVFPVFKNALIYSYFCHTPIPSLTDQK